jgi:transcriptional regulator with XRE-family HTH domain
MRVLPTDAELIDLVKQTFNYDTDVQVAGFLGVTKDTVSAIRNNRTVVGEGLRFTILDKLLVLDKIAYRKGENILFRESETEGEDRREPQDAGTDDLQHRSLASACSPKVLLIRLREWRREQRQAQHDRWALKETEDGPPESEDAELLNLYKEYRQFDTDAQVSKTLGIKRNSISMVRHGRSRLGPLPRLRIYRDVYGRDTSKLEAALESSEALLNLMKHGAT